MSSKKKILPMFMSSNGSWLQGGSLKLRSFPGSCKTTYVWPFGGIGT